jgi:predicted naringenin-chalcone synthase
VSKILSIGTTVPAFRHEQDKILGFMQHIFALNETEQRKLKYLYHHSGIRQRHSVIADYSRHISDWKFYPHSENLEPFPSLEQRMMWYTKYAAPISVDAIRECIGSKIHPKEITHLITVSCTGMSAPGLDLQIMELMDLPKTIFRTSINFMGCYAGIHALKLADCLCYSHPESRVLVVCTELCTLHFQREPTWDNIASSLLFADGAAAALIVGDNHPGKGVHFRGFYSEVLTKGKKDMAWELSSTGFLMTLSSYIPDLIEEDFERLVSQALNLSKVQMEEITHWCIHPGGKKILDAIHKSLHFTNGHLDAAYEVLNNYGNMSSPTILFVLQKILTSLKSDRHNKIFGAAFGPGLTMETFIAES